MTTNDKSHKNKSYSTPSLQAYGNIRALTKATNPSGAMGDGAMAGSSKT